MLRLNVFLLLVSCVVLYSGEHGIFMLADGLYLLIPWMYALGKQRDVFLAQRRLLVCCAVIVCMFLLFDLLNALGVKWIVKGLARNATTAAAVMLIGSRLPELFKGSWCFALLSAQYMSLVAFSSIDLMRGMITLNEFFRYRYAAVVICILLTFLPVPRILRAMLYAASAVIIYKALDIRSHAFVYLAMAMLLVCKLMLSVMNVGRRLRAVMLWSLSAAFVALFISSFSSVSLSERSEQSNFLRMHMIEDAWHGFLASPIIGHGSAQHYVNYVNIGDVSVNNGVHSWIFQLAYEYGVLGITVAGGLCVILGRGLWSVVMDNGTDPNAPWRRHEDILLFCLLDAVNNVFNAPFSGFGRIFVGLGVGVALFVIHATKPQKRVVRERRQICSIA